MSRDIDPILDLIDGATIDWELTSSDAMRWTPEPTTSAEQQRALLPNRGAEREEGYALYDVATCPCIACATYRQGPGIGYLVATTARIEMVSAARNWRDLLVGLQDQTFTVTWSSDQELE